MRELSSDLQLICFFIFSRLLSVCNFFVVNISYLLLLGIDFTYFTYFTLLYFFSGLKHQEIPYSVQCPYIYLTDSNSLVEDLTAATATKLYLNSSFYSHHPYIVSLSQNYPNIFRCPENVLMMSVSQRSIDSNKKLSYLVK